MNEWWLCWFASLHTIFLGHDRLVDQLIINSDNSGLLAWQGSWEFQIQRTRQQLKTHETMILFTNLLHHSEDAVSLNRPGKGRVVFWFRPKRNRSRPA